MCCLYVEHPGQLSPGSGVWTKSARHSPYTRPLPLAPSLRYIARVRDPPLRSTELSPLPACVHSSPLCHRAEPSPPFLPPRAGPRCFYAMRGYKRRPPLHVIRNRAVSVSGKPSPPHRLCFSAAPLVPSRLTPPLSPCADPGALQGPRAAPRPAQVTPSPPLSSGAIDHAGELSLPRHPPS
jgi:hypothetical protein